jgi:hypothetical protein
MAGHVGLRKWSLLKVREGKYKGSMVRPRWKLEAKRGALKTYNYLREGKNQVIPIQ